MAAIHRRVNRNPLPRFYPGHFWPDLLDDAGRFVSDGERKLDNLRTDAAGGVVVDVGAADAHHFDADEDIGGPGDFRFRHLSRFEFPDAGE